MDTAYVSNNSRSVVKNIPPWKIKLLVRMTLIPNITRENETLLSNEKQAIAISWVAKFKSVVMWEQGVYKNFKQVCWLDLQVYL